MVAAARRSRDNVGVTRAFEEFEQAGWERIAAGYDGFFDAIAERLAPYLLDAAGIQPGSRVLDVGCGPGYVGLAALARGADVAASDIAASMIDLARARGLDAVQADAEHLPFPGSSFDAVTGNLLLPHLPRPDDAAVEMTRVLAPGGRLVLSTWASPSESRLMGVFVDAVRAAGAAPPPDFPAGPDVFRFADYAEITALLHHTGLSDIETRTIRWQQPHLGADSLWDSIMSGTVRTAALVTTQPLEVRRRIRREYDLLMQDHTTSIPTAVVLAVGRLDR